MNKEKIKCLICGRVRTKYAKNLCSSCYDKENRKKGICKICSGSTCRKTHTLCLSCLNVVFKPRLGTPTSIASRQKMSQSQIGVSVLEKHWNWKGGITKINTLIRHSEKSKQWRKEIMKRDNYTCGLCEIKGGNLEVHHIKKFSTYPELRFELSNGITLCRECHNQTKGCEQQFEGFFTKVLEFRLP